MNARTIVLAAGLAVCTASPTALHAAVPSYPIALSGTDGPLGPGMGVGVTFSNLINASPAINKSGWVAFRGNDSNIGTPHGIWIHNGASNVNVATAGGAQPGGGTYTAGTSVFNSIQINDGGDWAMRLGASTGLFGSVAGVPTRAMLSGDAAPGTGGGSYSSSASGMPLFNNAGHVGYIANLANNAAATPPIISTPSSDANNAGLWVGTPGSTSLVLRRNDAVTALDAGGNVRVGSLSNLTLSMNGSGRYVVQAALQGAVTTGTGVGSNDAMIATNRNGSLEVIAREGWAAPDSTGAASADEYRALGSSSIGFNDAGHVAFTSSLRNAAGTQTFGSALFTDTGSGVLRSVGRNGETAPAIQSNNPGEFAGATWGFFSNVVLNGAGQVAFSTTLGNVPSGTGSTLITMDTADNFTKVARQGEVAIPDGAPLGGDAFFTGFSSTAFNSAGGMVFQATLNGAGVFGGPGGNNSAMFAYTPEGGYCVIARTGTEFEVAPGDVRIVSSLGGLTTSGGEDGAAQSLNENGYFTFSLSFADGTSGVFVTRIPAPGAAPLLALAGLAACRRRRA